MAFAVCRSSNILRLHLNTPALCRLQVTAVVGRWQQSQLRTPARPAAWVTGSIQIPVYV